MSYLVRFAPIVLFLWAITVLSVISTEAGVFSRLAERIIRLTRGRTIALYLLTTVSASLITIFLGLDATAVIFTPIVIELAKKTKSEVFPFIMATLLLSNTASFLLPVSNLTNLLSQSRLGLTNQQYIAHSLLPALIAIVVTIGFLVSIFRSSIFTRFSPTPLGHIPDQIFLWLNSVACILFALLILLNISPVLASVISAGISVLSSLWRKPKFLSWQLIPAKLLTLTASLFALISLFNYLGLKDILKHFVHSNLDLLLSSALASNLFNNLPAYLAFEPAIEKSRTFVLLLGVNFGSIILPWGSLATLLWAQSCRANQVQVPWRKVILLAAILAPLILISTYFAV